jgi:predicted DNA-binding transcriptional regulator AlpA
VTTATASNAAPSLLIPDLEVCRLAGIGRTTFHRLRAAGKVGPQAVRLGRAVRYRREEVISWIAADCPDARTWAAMLRGNKRRAV